LERWIGHRGVVIDDVLVFGETKGAVPVIMFEIDLSSISGADGVKPIIEDDMVLRGDLSRVQTQDERN
jgi:hypothetical protein